ncbi:MAG: FHA domain-containing protein [Myxococcales bacterium]|nr:FHA domain-containing protein [Myxococcales bacterium]
MPGDDFEFSGNTRTGTSVDSAGAAAKAPTCLMLKSGEHEIPALGPPILMGRDLACQIHYESPDVSRFHAAVLRLGRTFVVRDLQSKNGTCVNGERVTVAPLRAGDKLTIAFQNIEVAPFPAPAPPHRDSCVVLFLDIAQFTSLSEKLGNPFIQRVSELLEALAVEALRRRGVVLKTLGDGFMAGFGLWSGESEQEVADAALDFARTALARVEKLPGGPPSGTLSARIGIAVGPVKLYDGDVFDVMGNTVNLASRLESANKQYGTQLLFSSALRDQFSQGRFTRELDTVCVRGSEDPVTIYSYDEVAARESSTVTTQKVHIDQVTPSGSWFYRQGLEAYRARDFSVALKAFDDAAKLGDRPAACMRKRVESMLAAPEGTYPEGWDGVWRMDIK